MGLEDEIDDAVGALRAGQMEMWLWADQHSYCMPIFGYPRSSYASWHRRAHGDVCRMGSRAAWCVPKMIGGTCVKTGPRFLVIDWEADSQQRDGQRVGGRDELRNWQGHSFRHRLIFFVHS